MLEILALIALCSKIGNIAREKGRKAIGYQLLTIALWFGGEFGGGLVGGIVYAIKYGAAAEDNMLFLYLFALGGAVVGAALSYFVVAMLPDVSPRANRPAIDPTTRW